MEFDITKWIDLKPNAYLFTSTSVTDVGDNSRQEYQELQIKSWIFLVKCGFWFSKILYPGTFIRKKNGSILITFRSSITSVSAEISVQAKSSEFNLVEIYTV